MACNELGSKLTDYEMGELSPAERTEVEAHLASCLDCQAELNLLQVTASAVVQACQGDQVPSETLSPERRDQIRKVARAQRSVAAARVVPFWQRLQVRSWSFGLSAAALLLLGLVGVIPVAMFTATGSRTTGLLDAPLGPGDRLVTGTEATTQVGQKTPAPDASPLTETAATVGAKGEGGASAVSADKPSVGLFSPQSAPERVLKHAPPVIARPTMALGAASSQPAAAPAPPAGPADAGSVRARLLSGRVETSPPLRETATSPDGPRVTTAQAPRPLPGTSGYRIGPIGAAATPAEAPQRSLRTGGAAPASPAGSSRGISSLSVSDANGSAPATTELAKSYVDKLTRMAPNERQKLKRSQANYLRPSSRADSGSAGSGGGGAVATGGAVARRAPSIVTDALAREKASDGYEAFESAPADATDLTLSDDVAAGDGSGETLGDADDAFDEGDVLDEAGEPAVSKRDAEETLRQKAEEAARAAADAARRAAEAEAKAKELAAKLAEEKEAADEARFAGTGINPFVRTSRDRLSTFAMDVDTASYVMGRSHLMSRDLPPYQSVRVEEWVNAFDYGYAPPLDGVFAVHAQAAPSPYRPNHLLLAVGLQARRVDEAKRRPAMLTFIVDVSGSMNMAGRLDLVRQSLRLLVEKLKPSDQVAIVEYDTSARTLLAPTSVDRRDTILAAIDGLRTKGSTNLAAGMKLGYQVADIGFDAECLNRVILCSDGVANTGATDAATILESVRRHADRGIFLTAVGVGMRGVNDALLEKLADSGNGVYALVDGMDEAKRIFVDGLSGTLETVARDAKIQVEFDPTAVRRWRLLGYENRAIADRDFRNDKVDAGEVGAGHSVTALYELDLTDAMEGSLGTVRVRYKSPQGSRVTEVAEALSTDRIAPSFAKASSAYRLAAVVAQFAEILRRSPYARGRTVEELIPQVAEVLAERSTDQRVVELETLIRNAASIEESKGMPTRR